jgi:two-component system, cell cycle sensor histidine kinase and response regulator CckA
MPRAFRMLIVEDSEDDAELIWLDLRRAGFEAVWKRVDNESDFVSALRTEQWDLIISDYQMPQFNGLRAFELFRDEELDIPFIFVSGALGEERAVEAMRAGARDYLLKGNLARLSAAVDRELSEAKNRERQRLAEAEALREQHRLEVAVEASGAGVFEYSLPSRGSVYLSDRWAAILGFTREELPEGDFPSWFFDRIHPDDREPTKMAYADFVAGRSSNYKSEARVLRADGVWADVAELARAEDRAEDGTATHVVGVMLDLSEQKRLESQFRQAQKMEAVGRLAGGVAHDFNNLLTAIFSFGQFVLEELRPEDPAFQDMQEVLKAASKAQSLTAQLLAFSRQRPMSMRVVDLNVAVGDVERILRRLLGEDIDLLTALAPDLWSVRIDPSAMEQVLVNLAVNARDAMPDGGKLTVETGMVRIEEEHMASGARVPPGEYVCLAISDTGHGMDEAVKSRIFEPFFTTKGPGKGTGLGLSTCYGIVKQANGFVWVYSELEKGTTFKIYLPRAHEAPEAQSTSRMPRSFSGTETILVVEDDEQVRRLTVRALMRHGYHVLEAMDGETAIERYGEPTRSIDLLVTDVVMPGMNGKQLAERLLATRPRLRVLFTTGYTANAIMHRGVVDQDANVLPKPFTPQLLLAKVRSLLDSD